MIFVTVGTTQFDELVEAIDSVAPKLEEEVIIQMGNGEFIPKYCRYFTFEDDLFKYFKQADIVVAHGGAGVTFEALKLGKILISKDNPNVLAGHQQDLLNKLSQDGYLIWCKDLNMLESCIIKAKKMCAKKYLIPECSIDTIIIEYLRHYTTTIRSNY